MLIAYSQVTHPWSDWLDYRSPGGRKFVYSGNLRSPIRWLCCLIRLAQ